MNDQQYASPKTAWSVVKKTIATVAIIPGLAFSSFGMSLTPVAYALDEGVCAPGTTETITLTSGEDTQTAGYTEINPVAAPASFAPALYDGGAFGDADITTAVIPPWVDPSTEPDLAGADWISTDESNNEGNAASDQWRLFSDSFELPAGAVIESADLWYTADNAAAVYLNGDPTEIDSTNGEDVYGTAPESPYLTFAEVYDTSLDAEDLMEGENTLNFILRNYGGAYESNPTGLIYRAEIEYCVPPTPDYVTVTIAKYIDGEPATAETADSADFPMSATWSDLEEGGIGAGTGTYALSETGFNTETPYQAVTAQMQPGADYTTEELLIGDTVGATCEDEKPFALEGYTIGDSLEEAEAGEPSLTVPALTDINQDQYIIVWNTECSDDPAPQESVTVTIHKFVDGEHATADSADNASFPMSATWNAENIGAGTGSYTLDATSEEPYEAQTVSMDAGADYSTHEVLTGEIVGATCDEDKPFALEGYTTGNTLAQAMAGTPSATIPAFTNLQNDKHVIVWNEDCSFDDGQIGGDVDEGDGVLEVTSIDAVDTSATANGSFEDGWEYLFHITAPTSEQDLAMKFSNWLRTGGGGTIPVAGNMRISSAQADNGGATILLTAADTYSAPPLHMTGDLNPVMDGRQVQVKVEVAVPAGTSTGSYTTNYGVMTND